MGIRWEWVWKIRWKWTVTRGDTAIYGSWGPGGWPLWGRGVAEVQPPFPTLSNLILLDSLTSRLLRFRSSSLISWKNYRQVQCAQCSWKSIFVAGPWSIWVNLSHLRLILAISRHSTTRVPLEGERGGWLLNGGIDLDAATVGITLGGSDCTLQPTLPQRRQWAEWQS